MSKCKQRKPCGHKPNNQIAKRALKEILYLLFPNDRLMIKLTDETTDVYFESKNQRQLERLKRKDKHY